MIPRYAPVAVAVFLVMIAIGLLTAPLTTWNGNIPIMLFFIMGGVLMVMMNSSMRMMVRDASKTVLLDSGHRESSHGLAPLCDVDLGGEPWPPASLYLVGGGSAYAFSMKDKHAVQVRKSSIEKLGEDTLIVYAPTQPLPGYFVKSLAPHESDQLARANYSGFVAEKDTESILHYSLLDSLHGIDSQALRQLQAFIANRHGKVGADEAVRVRKGDRAIIDSFRVLAARARSRTKRESVAKFFNGGGGAANEDLQANADKERVN